MTNATWWLIGLTLVLAIADWTAVGLGSRWEYVFKPATMVPLIAAALALEPVDDTARWWFVAALVASLAGDVLLMLPDDRLFVFGLGSFLVGHLAYVAGLAAAGVSGGALLVGAVVVAVVMGALAPRLVVAARRVDAALAVPVSAYITVISVMVAFAVGSTVPVAIAGAVLFAASDYMIGLSRFVRPFRGSRLAIITTYHVAQILLVVSLTRPR
ncbi:MAG TPA: lysoplasmalogenase [Microthrixaceae bacterium]|nr:lysoplasmalogenase [Microthrixaceae bacterium]